MIRPILLALAIAGADQPGTSPGIARVLTRSGERLVGTLSLQEVPVETAYGVLRVPIADVLEIVLAPVVTEADAQRIRGLVEALGRAEDEEEREAIRGDLLRAGPAALEALRAAEAGADEDLREVLGDLRREIVEASGGRRRDVDIVAAKRFTIAGRVRIDRLELAAAFGVLRIERRDIDRILVGASSRRRIWDRILVIKTWTDVSGEYGNVLKCLDAKRIRREEFTGTTAAQLKRALRGHGVLLIPELEQGRGAVGAVARQASAAIQRFVREGGTIICCGGDSNFRFLSESGILPCSGGSNSTEAAVGRRHPVVRGVRSPIPYANATFPIRVRGGRKMRPLATGGGGIIVGVASLGEGAVVYCGWDFYESAQPHRRVLLNAVRWAMGQTAGP